MYLSYWGLKKFPFDNVTDPSFFYLSESHEEALSRLIYASTMMKGGAMLTGNIGCGKTLISKVYMNALSEQGFQVCLLTNPPNGSVELLQVILYHMDLSEFPDSKTKLMQTLKARLMRSAEHNKGTIIIIDEAQILNKETFEEARLLLNLQSDNRFLLTLVLIGQTELKLKVKQMEQFDQRIAIRYHLQPFLFNDTAKYIIFREKKAGLKKNIFSTKAIKKIYEYSQGVPRVINSLCDLSLLIAFNKEKTYIDSIVVRDIIDELEQG